MCNSRWRGQRSSQNPDCALLVIRPFSPMGMGGGCFRYLPSTWSAPAAYGDCRRKSRGGRLSEHNRRGARWTQSACMQLALDTRAPPAFPGSGRCALSRGGQRAPSPGPGARKRAWPLNWVGWRLDQQHLAIHRAWSPCLKQGFHAHSSSLSLPSPLAAPHRAAIWRRWVSRTDSSAIRAHRLYPAHQSCTGLSNSGDMEGGRRLHHAQHQNGRRARHLPNLLRSR